jgi:hypothetical protein
MTASLIYLNNKQWSILEKSLILIFLLYFFNNLYEKVHIFCWIIISSNVNEILGKYPECSSICFWYLKNIQEHIIIKSYGLLKNPSKILAEQQKYLINIKERIILTLPQ